MNFLRKIFYMIPGLPWLYHFSWSFLGAVFFGFPSKDIFVIGITGTKGKTTAIELLSAVLEASGEKVAVLSSIKVKVGEEEGKNKTETTMPGRFFIQKFLRRSVKAGCRYVIIEVTSEGIAANRHLFIKWDVAALTNLAPEHIEAHGSFDKYKEAKLKLFRLAQKLCFINKDDQYAREFEKAAQGKVVWFGKGNLESQLAGEFNKYNVGLVEVIASELGVNKENIRKGVAGFAGIPGRMEFIQQEPFAVIVDYAHTPDSLKAVYQSLKPEYDRLICVLGSAGGGRDKWKRPEMGKIAAEYGDEVILTNEDPYDEDPENIIEEIAKGCPQAKKVIDRGEAIKIAIELAQSGDVVIITGKGSENSIHLKGGKIIAWSDREVVLRSL
jgi:UDP-N-acetylmuramoyl-L-alanyl-D-glutamate--2,6-diaminopimelate ligase